MSLLSFRCRHRYAGGFRLDAAFELNHTVTSLFGPSGGGKTTVLRVVAGLLPPEEGVVQLGQRTLVDTTRRVFLAPEKRHVGVVFQNLRLFPHLSVEGNLRYGARFGRGGKREVRFERVVEVLEIGGLLKRHPKSLSGGERQRVALGRALLSDPELLLMDEPLAALDEALKARILAYLERVIQEWNIPTVFVTHSQAEVRRLADWVIVMENGRVVSSGTPEEGLSRPEPLGWKNSMGPVNLLRVEYVAFHQNHVHGRVGDQMFYIPAESPPKGSPLLVAFQPADVALARADVQGLSVRNHIRGHVCQVVPVGQAVFVAIDIGQIFWAEVTQEAAAELEIRPGSEVTCLLKAYKLRLVS